MKIVIFGFNKNVIALIDMLVDNNFDFAGPLDFVKRAAGLSDIVMK